MRFERGMSGAPPALVRRVIHLGSFGLFSIVLACGSEPDATIPPAPSPTGALVDAGSAADATAPGFGAMGDTGAAVACDRPEMMLLLDRTLTMHQTPEGATPPVADEPLTKFAQAINAIHELVAPPADERLRFGLMLWPRDPGKDAKGNDRCITLEARLNLTGVVTNDHCEGPETLVAPSLSSGNAIRGALDVNTAHLCFSTPTGAALDGAASELTKARTPGRTQAIVLITDGADWDKSCPTPDPRDVISAAASQGIRTFVVGFDAKAGATGVGTSILSDMACAGLTAKDQATSCTSTAAGMRAVSPEGAPQYLRAQSGTELKSALQAAASALDCIR